MHVPLRTGPGAVYIYDLITAPAVRGGGAAVLATGLNCDYLRDQGIVRELGSVLPENAAAYVSLSRGGWRPVAAIASVRGRSLGARSNRLAMALAQPPHMAQPLAARVRRLREPRGAVVPRSWWGGVPVRGERLRPNGSLHSVVLHHTAWPAASLRTARAEAEYMRAIEHEHLLLGWWAIGLPLRGDAERAGVRRSRPRRDGRARPEVTTRARWASPWRATSRPSSPRRQALRALDDLLARMPDVPVVPHCELASDAGCPGRHLLAARSEAAGVEAVKT